ncbi:hypothetical protein, partial [Pseudomonas aeruginosa]|uniref:hypothetical protein n=1 Tax=Pseudomonas aeruginosa TaxID=287 RepID=UPI001E5CD032
GATPYRNGRVLHSVFAAAYLFGLRVLAVQLITCCSLSRPVFSSPAGSIYFAYQVFLESRITFFGQAHDIDNSNETTTDDKQANNGECQSADHREASLISWIDA